MSNRGKKGKEAGYWPSRMRKLRNRTRKMRVTRECFALDSLCETEASVWDPKTILVNLIQTEVKRQIKRLKTDMQGVRYAYAYDPSVSFQTWIGPLCQSVAPAPQSVNASSHQKAIVLQGDYFHSDT